MATNKHTGPCQQEIWHCYSEWCNGWKWNKNPSTSQKLDFKKWHAKNSMGKGSKTDSKIAIIARDLKIYYKPIFTKANKAEKSNTHEQPYLDKKTKPFIMQVWSVLLVLKSNLNIQASCKARVLPWKVFKHGTAGSYLEYLGVPWTHFASKAAKHIGHRGSWSQCLRFRKQHNTI